MVDKILDLVKGTPVFQTGVIDPRKIEYRQDMRDLCEQNVCRKYGTTWACPPGVGTIEECKERCRRFNTMVVFTGKFDLEDSFDCEGMIEGAHDFKKMALEVEAAVKPYLDDYIMFSNESCDTCEACTYPDAPCRFPEQVHHAIEGYGILVTDLASKVNVTYNNGPNTVTYFGAVMFNA